MLIQNKPTSNIELLNIARNKGITNLKVIMKDEFNIVPDTFYIINLQSSDNAGTHWTFCYCGYNICFYMDSYGAVPPEIIQNKLKRKYGEIHYSAYVIQDLKSQMCGYYCLGLVLLLHDKPETEIIKWSNNYINMFVDDTTKNNSILQKFFKVQ